jgi:DNA-binding MarR family transcriptional regulator
VEVTDAGLAVLRTLDEHRRAAAAAVLAPLSASDLAAVREALAKAIR